MSIVRILLWVVIVVVVVVGLALWLFPAGGVQSRTRDVRLISFISSPQEHADWLMPAGQRCGDAPFQFPTDGYIGYLWDDSFRPGHRHSGIDIFGGGQPGDTPIYAAADGYLTRLENWKSSLIIRLPQDPLQPDRQIWTYYTHLAEQNGTSLIAPDFPPGTSEVFVQAGTLLGRQGNFSGTPGSPTGVHLHFSVVLDDGSGNFLNELDIENTLDPSPYFGLPLNANTNADEIPLCAPQQVGGNP